MTAQTKAVGLNTYDGVVPTRLEHAALATTAKALDSVLDLASDEMRIVEFEPFIELVNGITADLQDLLLEVHGLIETKFADKPLPKAKSLTVEREAAWHDKMPASRRGATNLAIWLDGAAEAITKSCGRQRPSANVMAIVDSLRTYANTIRFYAGEELGGLLPERQTLNPR